MKIDLRLLWLALNRRCLLIFTILTGLAAGVLVVVQARLFSQVINLSFLYKMGLEDVSAWLVWLLGLILLRACLVWVSEAAAGELALRVKRSLRQRVFEHLQALGPAYLRSQESGELDSCTARGD